MAATAVAALGAACAAASPAAARGVAFDGSGGWVAFDTCAEEQACSAYQLPFYIDLGKGLTKNVYVYDDGLIGLGAPVMLPGDSSSWSSISSFADIAGQDVVSPYYNPIGPPTPAARVKASYPALDLVFLTTDYFGQDTYSEIMIAPASGNPGAFSLTFREGDSNLPRPIFPYPSLLGYQVGGDSVDFLVDAFNDTTVYFDLGSPGGSGGVPEPSVWGLMILGFGAAGTALRRRRAATCAA